MEIIILILSRIPSEVDLGGAEYDHHHTPLYADGLWKGIIGLSHLGRRDPLPFRFPKGKCLPRTGLNSCTKMRLGWFDPDQIARVYPGETNPAWLDQLLGGLEE